MNQLRFDENLAIREVLDDIVGMVDRRERLISSAIEQVEQTRDERTAQHVKKLEELMSEFVSLFEPIFAKFRVYGESLRESIQDSEAYLKSLAGIIEAGKAVEGASATLQELENDAGDVEESLQRYAETLDKVEDLLRRTSEYGRSSEKPASETSTEKSSSGGRPARARMDSGRNSRHYVFPGSRLSSYQPAKSQH